MVFKQVTPLVKKVKYIFGIYYPFSKMMNKPIAAKLVTAILLVILSASFSFASIGNIDTRNIYLAGLVVNAQTLSPIEYAKIYDTDNNLLGTTDKYGYYNITFKYNKSGEIYFKLKIVKQGFKAFVQNEHWGNLTDGTKHIMYFGLRASNSDAETFATFANSSNNNDLGYDNVSANVHKVKEQKEFNDKLANAKAGNQNTLIRVNNKFYIVDNSGWIQLNSDKDLISIDGLQVLAADHLNATIKRKDIKGMTPVDDKEAKFAIYTKSMP